MIATPIDRIGGPNGPSPRSLEGPPDSATEAGTRLGRPGSADPAPSDPAPSTSFAAALAAEASGTLRWSAHAQRRVEARGVALDAERLGRLERAVEVASARGARSSVVWLDRVAYVVHVPTATVVTAVAPNSGKEAVFTNIDSVVIA
ncbi:MAG: hypothetical protein KatS3mg065_0792 [Chloroflexota bacterium]|nr:MAG: hypothetical protein KatS3mg065_0792 [Chloroflexota bacterium]